MSPAAPRSRYGPKRSPEIHAAVLEAARDLVAELGYANVTMERIAERAGVSRMTAYRWWPNKSAVITEAFADRLAPGPTPDTGSAEGDALVFLRQLVERLTLLGGPSVVAGALAERGEPGRAALRDILHDHGRHASQLLSRSIAAGRLDADLPLAQIVDAWIGYVLYRIVFLEQIPTEQELTLLVARSLGAAAS
ncbi:MULTISPECIES: TetR/AcrR family transcriptional regulator [unclassified Streptomyces]|uniref:TetR/AcrR family transcriptional regulator n=1 Tax=unclassified Streptomyces TaxID=2593676 RepID=UPI0036E7BA8F